MAYLVGLIQNFPFQGKEQFVWEEDCSLIHMADDCEKLSKAETLDNQCSQVNPLW